MTDDPGTRRRSLPWWIDVIVCVVAALALGLVVKTFFVQAFVIPSGSMNPTLVEDDKLLVQKWTFWSGEPRRGDVVVFRDPGGWLDEDETATGSLLQRGLQLVGLSPTGGHLVKRVVGVAGDEVRCCDAAGRTMVNGEPVDEPYLANPAVNSVHTFQVTVPRGRIWVQGDNRGNSRDSRVHLEDPDGGFVPVDLVVGKAWLRFWPFDHVGGVGGTDAFGRVPAP